MEEKMKKIRQFALLTLIVTLSLFLLIGCQEEDRISSVYLKDHDPNTVIEMAVGDFDYSAYTVVLVYESGKTEEIALSENLIPSADQVKFFQVGDHDITVSYEGHKYSFKVSVKRDAFEGLSFPENNVFVYDGNEHSVEIEGNIPANAVVTYIGGNSFINAGTYDVTAVVSCDGYVTSKLSTTLTILRAKYDMSNVKFEAKEFVYDGSAHSVAISGTLPEGVSLPTYTIDEKTTSSATDVGDYKIKATFANDNPNYETIPDMETTLKITPAEYNINGVDIVFKKEDGKLIDGASKVYDGAGITFDLNDYSKLTNKVTVAFTVSDKDGKVISSSNKNTGIKNAGVYTIKVEFKPNDTKNYKPIEPIVKTFEVLKADYPALENIQFTSTQVVYDGKTHSIKIDGKLPEGVAVSYEYYLDGTLVVDGKGKPLQTVTDAGRYTVQAIFTHTDNNHGAIAEMSAVLNIEKARADASMFGFSNVPSIEYSGTSYEPKFYTWKDANGTEYDILQYGSIKYYMFDSKLGEYVEMKKDQLPTAIGLYKFSITASISDSYKKNYCFSNGGTSLTISSNLEIEKKRTEMPKITFDGNPTITYTGASQAVTYSPRINSELMVVSTAYFRYTTNGYVAMGATEIPTNVGYYRFVVTVSIKDENKAIYMLPNGDDSAQFSFDFEIQKKEVKVPLVSFTTTEKTIVYDGKAHNVVYTPTEFSEYVTVTAAYSKWDGEKYAAMEANKIPTAVGQYKFVVTVSLKDSQNYEFTNLKTSVEYLYAFEIQTRVIDVPEFKFDGNNATIIYDKNSHAVSYTPAELSQFVTITTTYSKWNTDKYVPMSANEIPTTVGKYEFVVSAKINDNNCIFANNEVEVKATFEFDITQRRIDVPTISFEGNATSLEYNGEKRPVNFTCTSNSEFITVTTA